MPKHRATKYVNPKAEEKSLFAAAGSFFGGLTGKIEPAQVLLMLGIAHNLKEVDPYFDEQKAYVIGLQNQLVALQALNEERLAIKKEISEITVLKLNYHLTS